MKIVKSKIWQFRIAGADLNSQLPLCYQAYNPYVEWYVGADYIQGWVQCNAQRVCPSSRLAKCYEVQYTRMKYKEICATYPLAGCTRYAVGTFITRKPILNLKSKKKYAPRSAPTLASIRKPKAHYQIKGCSYYKLTPDHLLSRKPETICIFDHKTGLSVSYPKPLS